MFLSRDGEMRGKMTNEIGQVVKERRAATQFCISVVVWFAESAELIEIDVSIAVKSG